MYNDTSTLFAINVILHYDVHKQTNPLATNCIM